MEDPCKFLNDGLIFIVSSCQLPCRSTPLARNIVAYWLKSGPLPTVCSAAQIAVAAQESDTSPAFGLSFQTVTINIASVVKSAVAAA